MIYISGKITGTTDYIQRFKSAELELNLNGYDYVVNPAVVNAQLPAVLTHKQYMKMSICMLSMCDTIYMLKGWETSKGAQEELEYAKQHNYKIIYQEGGY